MAAAKATLRLTVHAGARKEYIKERQKGRFEIAVKEPAEGNRANIRARELLASHFGVPLKAVRITSGHHRPHKTVTLIML